MFNLLHSHTDDIWQVKGTHDARFQDYLTEMPRSKQLNMKHELFSWDLKRISRDENVTVGVDL